jgi:hypothetical protein
MHYDAEFIPVLLLDFFAPEKLLNAYKLREKTPL